MKVNPISGKEIVPGGISGTDANNHAECTKFAEFLREEKEQRCGSEVESATGQPPIASQLTALLPIGSMFAPEGEMVGAIDGLCDELGGVVQSLATPGADLRTLENALSSLKTKAADLRGIAATLPNDPLLAELSEELDILAYVESIKWARGDYL